MPDIPAGKETTLKAMVAGCRSRSLPSFFFFGPQIEMKKKETQPLVAAFLFEHSDHVDRAAS